MFPIWLEVAFLAPIFSKNNQRNLSLYPSLLFFLYSSNQTEKRNSNND